MRPMKPVRKNLDVLSGLCSNLLKSLFCFKMKQVFCFKIKKSLFCFNSSMDNIYHVWWLKKPTPLWAANPMVYDRSCLIVPSLSPWSVLRPCRLLSWVESANYCNFLINIISFARLSVLCKCFDDFLALKGSRFLQKHGISITKKTFSMDPSLID